MSVVYSEECIAARKATREVALLPILVVLFVFSYAILTMLVFEQGKTIESQRTLIHEMLKDSTQLAILKGKIARDEAQHVREKGMAPSGQAATGAPGKDSPAAAGTPNSGNAKQSGKSARTTKEIPEKPAADLQDVRRLTRVI